MSKSIILKECNKLRKLGFEVRGKHLRFNWGIDVYMNGSDIPKIVRYFGYDDRLNLGYDDRLNSTSTLDTTIHDFIREVSFHLFKTTGRYYVIPDVNVIMGEIECPIEIIKRSLYQEQLTKFVKEIDIFLGVVRDRILKEETNASCRRNPRSLGRGGVRNE